MDAILFYLLFFLTQTVAMALAFIMANIDRIAKNSGTDFLSPDPVLTGTSLLVCESMLCAGLWLFFKNKKGGVSARTVPIRKTGMGVVATLLLSFGLSYLLDPLSLPDGGTTATFEAMRHSPLCLLGLCIVGPLCEEMVFRRGIVESLASRNISGTYAAATGAAAFALVHGNLAQGIPAFVIGLAFGLMYLRTRNLRLCFPAHVANNTAGVVALFFPQATAATSQWPLAITLPLGAVMLTLGFLLLRRVLK